MAGLHNVPWFEWVRSPGAGDLAGLVRLPNSIPPRWIPPPQPAKVGKVPLVNVVMPQLAPGPRLSDPTGAMSIFYEGLLRCETREPGARVRVLHYGDSPTTGDLVTADVRRLLQRRFGDGGHGFVLVDKPWAWYMHRGVAIHAKEWRDEPASQGDRARDRLHGLGGVSFRGSAGAVSTIEFGGRGHRRIEVQYLRRPGGGAFALETTDGRSLLMVETEGERESAAFATAILPPDANTVRVEVIRGSVRLFGLWAEKESPGVVYSSLGLNGAGAQTLLRFFEPSHWKQQIEHQSPDLIVINYGSNESDFPKYVDGVYASELRELIDRVRGAAPKSSILVMSPMDRGTRQMGGEIVTLPALQRVVKIQQQIAGETGVAFFNTYEAMGGSGTMARWYAAKPRLVSADFLHPMPAGAEKVGELFDQALYAGYVQWKAAHSR